MAVKVSKPFDSSHESVADVSMIQEGGPLLGEWSTLPSQMLSALTIFSVYENDLTFTWEQ